MADGQKSLVAPSYCVNYAVNASFCDVVQTAVSRNVDNTQLVVNQHHVRLIEATQFGNVFRLAAKFDSGQGYCFFVQRSSHNGFCLPFQTKLRYQANIIQQPGVTN